MDLFFECFDFYVQFQILIPNTGNLDNAETQYIAHQTIRTNVFCITGKILKEIFDKIPRLWYDENYKKTF